MGFASRSVARRWPMPTRDWRIHAVVDGSHPARTLYVDEELGLDDRYRLRPGLDDHRWPVGLSVGALPHPKAAVKMNVLETEFYPHLGWQAYRRSCPRYALAGSRQSHRQWIAVDFAPLCVAPSRGLLRHALHRCVYSGADGSLDRHPTRPWTASTPEDYPELLRQLQGPRVRQDAGLHHQQLLASGRHHLALYKSRWRWNSSSSGSSASSDQAVLRHVGERGEAQIWIAVRSTSSSPSSRSGPGRLALHFVTDPLGDPLRENAHTSSTCGRRKQMQRFGQIQPIEFIRLLTGH